MKNNCYMRDRCDVIKYLKKLLKQMLHVVYTIVDLDFWVFI